MDAATGAVLPGCIKTRPVQAAAVLSDDIRLWLGDCGVPPGAVPGMPTITCTDDFSGGQ
jgi:hypothetical protein